MRVSLTSATWLRLPTRRTLFIMSLMLLALALILWKLSVPSANAADQPLRGATPPASTEGFGLAASGAAEDTLKACLARIPKDASAGQRMIAEQGCERDNGDRKLIQAVPGR